MITISNISFFRFCRKNRKLDWPKCARTLVDVDVDVDVDVEASEATST